MGFLVFGNLAFGNNARLFVLLGRESDGGYKLMRFKLTVYQACWLCILQALLACVLGLSSAYGAPSFNDGVTEFNAKHYSRALALFQNYSKGNPSNVLAHYYTGLCYQYLNQVASASSQYQWVATYSTNPKLKAQAEGGLSELKRYQASRSYQVYSDTNTGGGTPGTGRAATGFAPGRIKVMEFHTQWCGVCKKFSPVFERVRGSYGSRCDMQSLDAEDSGNQTLVQRYQIGSYPTTVLADSSGKVIHQFSGAVDETGLKSIIDQCIRQVQ